MQDLFIKPLSNRNFEKVSTYRLPRNTSIWNQEILRILYDEYPWLITEGTQPLIQYQDIEADSGTAVGAVTIIYEPLVERRERKIRKKKKNAEPAPAKINIPIIVSNFELYPFDTFIGPDGIMHPLTQSVLAQAIQPSDNFSGLYWGDTSIENIDHATGVPQAAFGRYGRNPIDAIQSPIMAGQASKLAADSTPNSLYDDPIMAQILPAARSCHCDIMRKSVMSDPATLQSWVRSGNYPYLKEIVQSRGISPDDYENIQNQVLPENVYFFQRTKPGRWRVVIFSDILFSPRVENFDETALLARFGQHPEINDKIWTNEEFIITSNHDTIDPFILSKSTFPSVEQADSGHYIVPTQEGEFIRGHVLSRVCDCLGNASYMKLFIGDNNTYAFQDGLVGDPTGMVHEDPFSEGDVRREWSTFVFMDNNGFKALVPFKIRNFYTVDGSLCILGHDSFGQMVSFIMTPGLLEMESVTGVASPILGDLLGANAYRIPEHYRLVLLGRRVNACRTTQEFENTFSRHSLDWIVSHGSGSGRSNAIYIRKVGKGFQLEGTPLEPLSHSSNHSGWGSVNGEWCHKRAKLALVLLGLSLDDASTALSLVDEANPVIVSNIRPLADYARKGCDMKEIQIKGTGSLDKVSSLDSGTMLHLDWEGVCDGLRENFVKEAAVLKDPDSIDSLLSLNFITPENLLIYIQSIPKFEDCSNKLAELLLLARVGLKPVPERAIYTAMKGLANVVESLKLISIFLKENVDYNEPQEREADMTPEESVEEGKVERTPKSYSS